MIKQSTKNELAIATIELKKAFKNFEKAAKKYLAVIDGMGKKKHRKLKEFFEQSQQIHEFLIQIEDDSSQIGEKGFGLRCAIGKGEEEK
jgi:DNA repair protein RadC